MQQPDYRDQSEPDVNDETKGDRQAVSNESRNQKSSRMEQEKEIDHALVSSAINNMTATVIFWRPDVSHGSQPTPEIHVLIQKILRNTKRPTLKYGCPAL